MMFILGMILYVIEKNSFIINRELVSQNNKNELFLFQFRFTKNDDSLITLFSSPQEKGGQENDPSVHN